MAPLSGGKVLPQYYPIFCLFKEWEFQGQTNQGLPWCNANARLAVQAKLLAQRLCITGFNWQYSYIVGFPFYLPFSCTVSFLYQAFKNSVLLLLPEIFKIIATGFRWRSGLYINTSICYAQKKAGLKELSSHEAKSLELSTQELGRTELSVQI